MNCRGGAHGQIAVRHSGSDQERAEATVDEVYSVNQALDFLIDWPGATQDPVYETALNLRYCWAFAALQSWRSPMTYDGPSLIADLRPLPGDRIGTRK